MNSALDKNPDVKNKVCLVCHGIIEYQTLMNSHWDCKKEAFGIYHQKNDMSQRAVALTKHFPDVE